MRALLPRFFFNFRDDVPVEDTEGRGLPDEAKALEMAVTGAREFMSGDVKDDRLLLQNVIEIIEDKGDKVPTLPFREAIDIEA